MVQIKTFNAGTDQEINEWLKDNPSIEIIKIERAPIYDMYSYGEPQICNQWIDVIVTYTLK